MDKRHHKIDECCLIRILFHVKQSYIYTKIPNNAQKRPKNIHLLCFHHVSQYVSRETQQNIVSRETNINILKYIQYCIK